MMNVLQCVLPMVRSLVGNQTFEYQTYVGDVVNGMGISVPSYSAWKKCDGSVQPMDASVAQNIGLEYAEHGILVWGSIEFNTLDQQDHPDRVRYRGRVYICRRCTDWYDQNGWVAFACTEDKRERKSTATDENRTPEKIPVADPEKPTTDGGGVVW